MKNNLLGRIKRTIKCKKRHFYAYLYSLFKPESFFKHPYLSTMLWHGACIGRLPNLLRPRDFNELLMSINLKALKNPIQRDLRIQCADKYAVRSFLAKRGYEDLLIECIGVYDSFDEIDFDKLPNQFVLKMTNGSHMNYICTDKKSIDLAALQVLVNGWFKEIKTFGLKSAEWHYSLMPARLIVEKYMSALDEGTSLIDYKFHCFNGIPYRIGVGYDRNPLTGTASFDTYDMNWNVTDSVRPEFHQHSRPIPRPINFERMKEIAADLSSNCEYVRVDLYEIGGKIYFGELTYTPSGNIASDYKDEVLLQMVDFYKDSLTKKVQ